MAHGASLLVAHISGLAGVCQDRLGHQFDGSQGAGAPWCLAEDSQAMMWNDDGDIILSPPLTGLTNWTSLHKDELSKQVAQNMGMCFCACMLMHTNLGFQLEQKIGITGSADMNGH
jgi:hypothetical protein